MKLEFWRSQETPTTDKLEGTPRSRTIFKLILRLSLTEKELDAFRRYSSMTSVVHSFEREVKGGCLSLQTWTETHHVTMNDLMGEPAFSSSSENVQELIKLEQAIRERLELLKTYVDTAIGYHGYTSAKI